MMKKRAIAVLLAAAMGCGIVSVAIADNPVVTKLSTPSKAVADLYDAWTNIECVKVLLGREGNPVGFELAESLINLLKQPNATVKGVFGEEVELELRKILGKKDLETIFIAELVPYKLIGYTTDLGPVTHFARFATPVAKDEIVGIVVSAQYNCAEDIPEEVIAYAKDHENVSIVDNVVSFAIEAKGIDYNEYRRAAGEIVDEWAAEDIVVEWTTDELVSSVLVDPNVGTTIALAKR